MFFKLSPSESAWIMLIKSYSMFTFCVEVSPACFKGVKDTSPQTLPHTAIVIVKNFNFKFLKVKTHINGLLNYFSPN